MIKLNKNHIITLVASLALAGSSATLGSTALKKFLKTQASATAASAKGTAIAAMCAPHLEFIKSVQGSVGALLDTNLGILKAEADSQRTIINNIAVDLQKSTAWANANKTLGYIGLPDGTLVMGVPNPYLSCYDTSGSSTGYINLLTDPSSNTAVHNTNCLGADMFLDNSTGQTGTAFLNSASIGTTAATDWLNGAVTPHTLLTPAKTTIPMKQFADSMTSDGAFNGITVHTFADATMLQPFTLYESHYACPTSGLDYASTDFVLQKDQNNSTINAANHVCYKGTGTATDGIRNNDNGVVTFDSTSANCGGNCHWFCAGGDGIPTNITAKERGNCAAPNPTGNTSTSILYSQTVRVLGGTGGQGQHNVDLLVPMTNVNCKAKNTSNVVQCSITFAMFSAGGMTTATLPSAFSAQDNFSTLGSVESFSTAELGNGPCNQILQLQ